MRLSILFLALVVSMIPVGCGNLRSVHVILPVVMTGEVEFRSFGHQRQPQYHEHGHDNHGTVVQDILHSGYHCGDHGHGVECHDHAHYYRHCGGIHQQDPRAWRPPHDHVHGILHWGTHCHGLGKCHDHEHFPEHHGW